VQALMSMRGVQLIAAMTLVAELQDFVRFQRLCRPSHLGWQPKAPSRSPSGGGHQSDLHRRGMRSPSMACT
jgi:hypothetical protein